MAASQLQHAAPLFHTAWRLGAVDNAVKPRCTLPNKRTCHPTCLWQDKGGVIPALQKLSYAGKNMEDPQRTLEQ